jgi:quercetin dioxygenase-like cupin family protein
LSYRKRERSLKKELEMFYKKNDEGYKEALEGIRLKTLVYGEKTLMSEFRLNKGKTLPMHSHPHEQAGYVVSGRINLIVEGEKHEAGPGDGWCILGGVEHGAETLEDSLIVEVFSPVREDYLP